MTWLDLEAVKSRILLESDINFFKILRTSQVVVAMAYYDGYELYKNYGVRLFLQTLL